jgi:hypothetical protein
LKKEKDMKNLSTVLVRPFSAWGKAFFVPVDQARAGLLRLACVKHQIKPHIGKEGT